MRIFKITDRIKVECESKKTRIAFKHEAVLLINGVIKDRTKICYQNRAWERYEFESVLKRIVMKTMVLSKEEKNICNNFINDDRTDWTGFKSIGAIAEIGNIFCNNKKDKNDWKKRMINAGFKNKGLSIPDDWKTLNENEKERRLNKVITLIKSPN